MYEAVGIGVYLVLGLVILVAILAVFRNGEREGLTPLTTLLNIAEEAHRHPDKRAQPWASPSAHALPWVIPPAPVGAYAKNQKATPTLGEISERLDVIEARLNLIAIELKEKTASAVASR
jgi:hypothetical protein